MCVHHSLTCLLPSQSIIIEYFFALLSTSWKFWLMLLRQDYCLNIYHSILEKIAPQKNLSMGWGIILSPPLNRRFLEECLWYAVMFFYICSWNSNIFQSIFQTILLQYVSKLLNESQPNWGIFLILLFDIKLN